MADKILLNGKIYSIKKSDLPCLINYGEKAGGSHFSVTMVADLFLRGAKILFLTAYPMAKDNFLRQSQGLEDKIIYVTHKKQLDTRAQAIILESGNEKLFLQAINVLDDINERVILIKNMEVFSKETLDVCLPLQKIILSGNIDKCVCKKQISDKKYKTIITFTKPHASLPIEIPILEKYTGYLWNKNRQGFVKVNFKK